ncbi:hypothetical protein MPH_12450 [Macrophomina phaseolina MS6]|uniref:Organic solute transporter Ost-alpha n=1 Tax=Macrophomina phaseolina (strain MS6) TaxID=1126212 RepID=K2RCI3_MACPH|nr:hypothetical protein MPH_12450 [Macrophomina phaseolina MS6]
MLESLKNSTCPVPISTEHAKPLSVGITLHRLLIYVAAPCVAIACCVSLFLVSKHLHRYTRPAEQRQIVRLIMTPFFYAIFSLLALIFYGAHDYLTPLPDLYEAFALTCLFILFIHYSRNPTVRNEQGFTRATTRNGFDESVPLDIQRAWIFAFQYPLVKTILTIAQLASTATGTYCEASRSIHFGHFWIQLIGNVSLSFCFITIVRFYGKNKSRMTVHQPVLKLVSFKLIVFVIFLQSLVFNFIPTPTGLSSNGTVSPRDIKYGIGSFLVCVEMVFFAIGFHFSFRSRMYHPSERDTNKAMSFGAAVFDAANPSDLVMDIMQMFSTQKTAKYAPQSQHPRPDKYAQRSPSAHPLVPQNVVQRPISPLHMPSQQSSPQEPPMYYDAGNLHYLGTDTAYKAHP